MQRLCAGALMVLAVLHARGPFLPAYTDGILSERLTGELTRALAAQKPDWTVLVFPQIPFGASGYTMLKILGGADPSQFQRYADLLDRNPLYQAWVEAAAERDDRLAAAQREWIERRR